MSDFARLIDAWLDQEIEPHEVLQLQEYLRENPNHVQEFAEQVSLSCLLYKSHFVAASMSVAAAGKSVGDQELQSRPTVRAPRRGWVFGGIAVALATALILVIAPPGWLSVGNQGLTHRVDATQNRQGPAVDAFRSTAHPLLEVARIQSISDVDEATYRVGQRLIHGDRLQFGRGVMTLEFAVGATVTLAGPARLDISSSSRAVLHRGQVTASVMKSGEGFTIVTPYADVIDLGTRFGVNVRDSGEADVVVFEGRVEIDYRVREENEQSHRIRIERLGLSVGEAVRVEGYGNCFRIPVIHQQAGSEEWSTGITETNSSLIASLSDNLSKSDRPMYYGVVPGGFGEDAPAYLDRPHEWNSMPGASFPDALDGRDYVRLRNDLKYVLGLKLSLELRRTASIYVLFDDRVPPPEWLQQGFTLTNLRIGMDEAPPDRSGAGWHVPTRDPLASGPGRSVDSGFAVWVRHCAGPETVVLGSLIEREMTRTQNVDESSIYLGGLSMYGIVVAPNPAVANEPGVP